MRLAEPVVAALRAGDFAFIDAGCASGESIDHCQRRFGLGRGLGLDWYGQDLSVARSRGLAAEHCDLVTTELPPHCVTFTSMIDFLEHLPNLETAARVLEKCAAASRGFLYIRHPSFDDRDYLAAHGLRMAWADWTAHPNRMRVADFRRVFEAAGWRDYVVIPDAPMLDSSHPALLPLSAPIDTEEYDPAIHDPKPYVAFDRVIYGKYDMFVRLAGLSDAEWRRIAAIDGWRAIWDSPSAKRMAREGGVLHYSLDSLMRGYASAGEHATEATRARMRAVVAAHVRRDPRFAIQLVHLLDALGRTADVNRVLVVGDDARPAIEALRARFPAMTIDEASTGAGYDFVVALGGGDDEALRAVDLVRPGGWHYSVAWGSGTPRDAPIGAPAIAEPLTDLLAGLDLDATDRLLPDVVALARLDLEPHRHARFSQSLGGKTLRRC